MGREPGLVAQSGMIRGSRAGVDSSRCGAEQGEEGPTGVEVAVMTVAEGEVTNPGHTGPAHLGAAPVATFDALASVVVADVREARAGDIEDPWAHALRGKILEGTEWGVRDEEVQEPEGLFGIPDTGGELIHEDLGNVWSRYPRKSGSFSWDDLVNTERRDAQLIGDCRSVEGAWSGWARARWLFSFATG